MSPSGRRRAPSPPHRPRLRTTRHPGLPLRPTFQGLQAAWQHHDTTYAEITLPQETQHAAAAFTLHPALLDAALHATDLAQSDEPHKAQQTALPFAWSGVTVHAKAQPRCGWPSPPRRTTAYGSNSPTRQAIRSPWWRSWPCGPSPPTRSRQRATVPITPLYLVEWTALPSATTPPGSGADRAEGSSTRSWAALGPQAAQ
ncbi:polyketide synthase dehydratase domain-containing protein, partial [Streptomyces sioyaensis]|uniref:polyketide synthase dehydratase domain-containing protein n=1 Tax=Streptomyces sioyaensis TaxID=67364 RepID=UPI0027DAE6EF